MRRLLVLSMTLALTAGFVQPTRAVETGPPQPHPNCGSTRARIISFRVAVDRGLNTTAHAFKDTILRILCDKRSWIASGRMRWRYNPKARLLIGLHTAAHKNQICYPYTGNRNGYGSCYAPNHVVLNADRWFTGSRFWPSPLREYRRMLVNHEVGHSLGQRHRLCPASGARAPVMMQQTLRLTTNGRTCKPNPWPLAPEVRSLRT